MGRAHHPPGTQRTRAVVGAAMLLAFSVSACQRREAPAEGRIPVVLGPRGAQALEVHPSLPLGSEAVLALAAQALEQSAQFAVVAAPQSDPLAAQLHVSVQDARREEPEAEGAPGGWTVRVGLSYLPPLAVSEERDAVQVTGQARHASTPEAAISGGVSAAVDALSVRLAERHRPFQELLIDFRSGDERRVRTARDELAARRHPLAVPSLLRELQEGSEAAAGEALSRLLAYGDPAMVRPIISAAEQRSFGFLLEAIHALGALGGEEAEAYLFIADTGHEDPRVREAAREALELAQRRRGGALSDAEEGVR